MFIVHVFVHVKRADVEAFKQATSENAACSRREPGIARFDVVQELADPTRFVLVEIYRTEGDTVRHKETEHYRKWRDTVENMMASPRTSIKFVNISPDDGGF
jgi:(4S)-4-hydroxy-5-phosphonooxypentane-2,3-dione isomerase